MCKTDILYLLSFHPFKGVFPWSVRRSRWGWEKSAYFIMHCTFYLLELLVWHLAFLKKLQDANKMKLFIEIFKSPYPNYIKIPMKSSSLAGRFPLIFKTRLSPSKRKKCLLWKEVRQEMHPWWGHVGGRWRWEEGKWHSQAFSCWERRAGPGSSGPRCPGASSAASLCLPLLRDHLLLALPSLHREHMRINKPRRGASWNCIKASVR